MAESKHQKIIKKDGVWTVDGRPREEVEFLFEKRPSNLPGKRIIALLVSIPPKGATPPHTHSGAAVSAFMLSGKALNQMNDDPPFVSGPGQAFFEGPGCRHVRSENVSDDPNDVARFYAHFVIDDKVIEEGGYEAMVVMDADREEEQKEREKKSV